jgi:hypothetical protein
VHWAIGLAAKKRMASWHFAAVQITLPPDGKIKHPQNPAPHTKPGKLEKNEGMSAL